MPTIRLAVYVSLIETRYPPLYLNRKWKWIRTQRLVLIYFITSRLGSSCVTLIFPQIHSIQSTTLNRFFFALLLLFSATWLYFFVVHCHHHLQRQHNDNSRKRANNPAKGSKKDRNSFLCRYHTRDNCLPFPLFLLLLLLLLFNITSK